MTSVRRLTASKQKLLDPNSTTLLWDLWVLWYQKTKERAYHGDAKTYELGVLKQTLQQYTHYQIAFAFTEWMRDWPYPTIVSFCQWLQRDRPMDEVFNDSLQARAYYLYEMTRDPDLWEAIRLVDADEAARSFGHHVDLEEARSQLLQVCDEVSK